MRKINVSVNFVDPEDPLSKRWFVHAQSHPELELGRVILTGDGRIGIMNSFSRAGFEKSIPALVAMEVFDDELLTSDYYDMLTTISGQLSEVAINTHEAINAARSDKELIEDFLDWNKTTLSDFILVVTIDLTEGHGLTVTSGSFCLLMKAPEDHETSRLPLDDAEKLPGALIYWLKEQAGIEPMLRT